jgi:hypothetical protein
MRADLGGFAARTRLGGRADPDLYRPGAGVLSRARKGLKAPDLSLEQVVTPRLPVRFRRGCDRPNSRAPHMQTHENQLPPAPRVQCDDDASPAHSAPALTLSRRALIMNTPVTVASLGSATALESSSTFAPAMPAAPDPIFAVIERHKVAFRISQTASRIQSHTVDAEWSPEYDPV